MQTTIASANRKIVVPPPMARVKAYLNEVKDYIPGEIRTDEHGRLFKEYIKYEAFLSYLSKGYDMWIKKILPRQLRSKHLKIGDNIAYFVNPLLIPPMLSVSSENPKKMWPKVARDRELDYSGALYADLVLVKDGEIIEKVNKVHLGMIPIMLGSEFDHLRGLSDREKLAKGECPSDPLHYFIAKGSEKVILLHEKVSAMKIILSNDKTPGEVVAKMTNETYSGSTVVSVVKHKNGVIHLHLSTFGKREKNANTINVLSIFQLLGMKETNEIIDFIMSFTKEKWTTKLREKLNLTYLDYLTSGDPTSFIAKIKGLPSKDDQSDVVLNLVRDALFPQVPSNPSEDRRKLAMLAQMVTRLLEYMAGFRKLDNREDWGNKRLDSGGESMKKLFQTLYSILMDDLQHNIDEKPNINLPTIASGVKEKIITESLASSISSNNWGVKSHHKKKNIVEHFSHANILDAYSELSRIKVLGQENSGNTVAHIRMTQPTACGFVCPAETPERKGCGTTKNMAAGSVLTVHDPEMDPVIIDFIKSIGLSEEKDPLNETRCWFNGIFLGWCPGLTAKEDLIEARRLRDLPEHMSVVLDPYGVLHVNTTSSRVARPLLIVNPETQQPVIEEKGLFGEDFAILLQEEAVEYIDAFEQNHSYVAESLESLRLHHENLENAYQRLGEAAARKAIVENNLELPPALEQVFTQEEFDTFLEEAGEEIEGDIESIDRVIQGILEMIADLDRKGSYDYVELEPSSLLGFAGSLIPLPDRNMGPRITYACAMGKQALGTVHSHQKYRFDTSVKRLAYPSRSLFETQMAKQLGFHDLPDGQSPIIAITMLQGWNQEDAFIVNRASLERGLFRYIKEYTKKAIEKKENEVEEIITRPEIRPNEPASRYANLDDNGIIRVGSVVNPRDAIIGRVRKSASTGEVENATVFASDKEQGIVEEVFITNNRSGRKIVYVKIRDTRIPEKGDKFALRPAQKGTIGLVMDPEDMPYTLSGVIPDIIMNPLALPSRMTMGTIMEILTSKVTVLTGTRYDATAFRKFDLDTLMDQLKTLGYNRTGDEVLYSGTTGKPLKSQVFIGISHVQKLKHDVTDKIQARGTGPVVPRHRQPVRGRKHGGGQRLGEMEFWALMSHGSSSLIKEKSCEASDATQNVYCTTCGTIPITNHVDQEYTCNLCGDKGNFARGTIPYVMNVLNHTLGGLNVGMTYKFRNLN